MKLSVNIKLANGYHRELYLGTSQGGHADHFKDERLLVGIAASGTAAVLARPEQELLV